MGDITTAYISSAIPNAWEHVLQERQITADNGDTIHIPIPAVLSVNRVHGVTIGDHKEQFIEKRKPIVLVI